MKKGRISKWEHSHKNRALSDAKAGKRKVDCSVRPAFVQGLIQSSLEASTFLFFFSSIDKFCQASKDMKIS